jgi:competence protein ComEC
MGGLNAGARLAGLAAAWLAGTAWQLQQAASHPLLYLALLLAGASALLIGWHRPRGWALAWLGAALCAAGLAGLQAQHRLNDVLAAELEGQDLWLTGVVAGLPRTSPEGTRFVFEVEQAQAREQAVQVPRRLSLGWYRARNDADGDAADPAPELPLPRAGERWRLPVRLRQPHGTLNPHGFDYELWLFEQGIRATGQVRVAAATPAQRLDEAAGYPLQRWRQRVHDAIVQRVPDARAAGVLAALSVGDQSAIDRADWDVFRNTGTAHVMAISGIHITMLAWLGAAVLGRLWRHSERLMLWCPAPVAARWCGVGVALLYALFAGWGVPAQRTVCMLASAALLAGFSVRWPWPLVLAWAAVVVSAFDPWALLQPGFWLSFAAVGLLMASEPAARDEAPATTSPPQRLRALLASGLRTQAIASIGLAPLTLVLFQQVSLIGFVANLVAIPLVTLLITPLALLGALLPWAWDGAAVLVSAMSQALAALAGWPLAVWVVPVAPGWAQGCGLLAALLLLAPLPWRLRALGVPLLLPLLWPPVARPADGQFELVVADVGQGSAVLLRTREHLLVYDAGPQYSPQADAGERVLLPLLRARGEHRIDLLMLSHRDTDHVGGAEALIAALPVQALASSLQPEHPLLQHGLSSTRCEAGQRWQWEQVQFEVLHPTPADYARVLKPNALSCVLRVTDAQGFSVLLAGDIERAQEASLVAAHGEGLASDLLLVPHHGSRTSSTDDFLQAVAPSMALVQAGYLNRFGHPAPDVQARYRARGIALVRSDRCGAWTWRAGEAWCERDRLRRYWQAANPR